MFAAILLFSQLSLEAAPAEVRSEDGRNACAFSVAAVLDPTTTSVTELIKTITLSAQNPDNFKSQLEAARANFPTMDIPAKLYEFYASFEKSDLNLLAVHFGKPAKNATVLSYLSSVFGDSKAWRAESLKFAVDALAAQNNELLLVLVIELAAANPETLTQLKHSLGNIAPVVASEPGSDALARMTRWRRLGEKTLVVMLVAGVASYATWAVFVPEQTPLKPSDVILPPPSQLPTVPSAPVVPKMDNVKPKPVAVADLRAGVYRLTTVDAPEMARWLNDAKVTVADHFFGDSVGKKVTLEAGNGQKMEYFFLEPTDAISHANDDARIPKEDRSPRASSSGALKIISNGSFEIRPRAVGLINVVPKSVVLNFAIKR